MYFEVHKRKGIKFQLIGVGGRWSPLRYELYSDYRQVRGTSSPITCLTRFTDGRDFNPNSRGFGEAEPQRQSEDRLD